MSDSFWNRFVRLCDENKISTSSAIKQLHIPPYIVKNWKGGIWPHNEWVVKLSEFFKVPEENLTYTPDYRMSSTPADAPAVSTQEWRFIQVYRRHPERQSLVDKLLDFFDEA